MIKLFFLFIALVTIVACNEPQQQMAKTYQRAITTTETDTFFIHQDTANLMKSSYLESILLDSPASLKSWSINADALRNYLADPNVREVNIALGHTMQYINSGHFGVPAGLSTTALTVVLTGVGSDGSQINYNTSYVLDRAKPCPPICLSNIHSK